MSDRYFIDTNVFIYHLEASDEHKFAVADKLIREGIASGNACISFQVVQECLNTALRKAEIPLDALSARAYLNAVLTPLWRVMPSAHLYEHALELQARYRFSFYDALIVAGALGDGCTRLFSEDLQHGQRLGKLVILNPFVPKP